MGVPGSRPRVGRLDEGDEPEPDLRPETDDTLEPATRSHTPEMIALRPGTGMCLYGQYPRIAA
jgi:hypothetical protein